MAGYLSRLDLFGGPSGEGDLHTVPYITYIYTTCIYIYVCILYIHTYIYYSRLTIRQHRNALSNSCNSCGSDRTWFPCKLNLLQFFAAFTWRASSQDYGHVAAIGKDSTQNRELVTNDTQIVRICVSHL